MIRMGKNFSAVLFSMIIAAFFLPLACCSTGGTKKTSSESPSTDATHSPVQINIKNDEIILSNNRVEVVISKPGKGYTGTRFDWSGIVKQVTLDGKHTFLSTERPGEYDPSLGFGLMGQFEPAFLRMAEGEYKEEVYENSVIFIKDLEKDEKGRGYKFEKRLILEGSKLIIGCTLTNYGDKAINLGEYNHNFFIINQEPVSENYELKFSFNPDIKTSPLIRSDLISLDKNTITWTKELTSNDEFLCQLGGYEKGKKIITGN